MIGADWLEDFRWAMLMRKARAHRRTLTSVARRADFDRHLQSRLPSPSSEHIGYTAYPDAFYEYHQLHQRLCAAISATAPRS